MILQPRLSSCKNAPIRTLTIFLHQLLRALLENCSQSTVFVNGYDFIKRLQQYCRQTNCFTSNTQFVTFQIHHLYTRMPHEDLLMALNQFLVQQLPGTRHQRLGIPTIEQLTKLVLQHHIFTYNGQIYRYVKGCPLNYAFTQLLFDIYLHQWQMILVRYIRAKNQFYGRYHDQGIFTWNDASSSSSSDDLHTCINELNERYPNIQLTTSSGFQVHFLHAFIENQAGSLHTRVYRDPWVQPFLLPFTTDHPRILHRQWFRFNIARALQYCLSFDDFQDEYVHIESTFLANGYSLNFIHYHWQQFLKRIAPTHLYNMSCTRSTYSSLRQNLFHYAYRKTFALNREQQMQQLVARPRSLTFFYLYDWGNRIEFNKKFQEFWTTLVAFVTRDVKNPKDIKLDFRVYTRAKHCYLSHTLLVQNKQINA